MTQGGLVRIGAWWLGNDEAHLLRLLVDTNGSKLDTRLFVFLPLLNQFLRDLQETVPSVLVNNMQLATQRKKKSTQGFKKKKYAVKTDVSGKCEPLTTKFVTGGQAAAFRLGLVAPCLPPYRLDLV